MAGELQVLAQKVIQHAKSSDLDKGGQTRLRRFTNAVRSGDPGAIKFRLTELSRSVPMTDDMETLHRDVKPGSIEPDASIEEFVLETIQKHIKDGLPNLLRAMGVSTLINFRDSEVNFPISNILPHSHGLMISSPGRNNTYHCETYADAKPLIERFITHNPKISPARRELAAKALNNLDPSDPQYEFIMRRGYVTGAYETRVGKNIMLVFTTIEKEKSIKIDEAIAKRHYTHSY